MTLDELEWTFLSSDCDRASLPMTHPAHGAVYFHHGRVRGHKPYFAIYAYSHRNHGVREDWERLDLFTATCVLNHLVTS
jgi:hypothetical protein